MNTHQLKSWPQFFLVIRSGVKNFDLRKDDRDYRVGDIVQLEEYAMMTGEYTGRVCRKRIGYILRDFAGLMPGYCILSLEGEDERRDVNLRD